MPRIEAVSQIPAPFNRSALSTNDQSICLLYVATAFFDSMLTKTERLPTLWITITVLYGDFTHYTEKRLYNW
jgi:hypothetical protein